MKIRLFGSEECKTCKLMNAEFKTAGIDFEFIDAILEDNQKLCDENNISELPHLQIIINDFVVLEIIGYINAVDLRKYMHDSRKFIKAQPKT